MASRLPYPTPTSADVTRRMRANRRTDTKPEIALRSELHRLGLRFRKDHPIRLARRVVRPDIVFTRYRLAIFVDGCFWHCCPIHGNIPRANSDYWQPKLARNVDRDRDVGHGLVEGGWQMIRFWEHDDPADAAVLIKSVVEARRLALPRASDQRGVRDFT